MIYILIIAYDYESPDIVGITTKKMVADLWKQQHVAGVSFLVDEWGENQLLNKSLWPKFKGYTKIYHKVKSLLEHSV
jgi:hypothetical protein